MKRIIVALTGASGAIYALPATLDDVVKQTVARALELLDIAVPGIKRWDGGAVAPDSNGLRTSRKAISTPLE